MMLSAVWSTPHQERDDHQQMEYARFAKGLIDGGDIKDEKKFIEILRDFDRANDLSYVKVLCRRRRLIYSKLMYRVEMSAPSKQIFEVQTRGECPSFRRWCRFLFRSIADVSDRGALRASVSWCRGLISNILFSFTRCRMFPVAFEVVPKSIARATVSPGARSYSASRSYNEK